MLFYILVRFFLGGLILFIVLPAILLVIASVGDDVEVDTPSPGGTSNEGQTWAEWKKENEKQPSSSWPRPDLPPPPDKW